LLVRFMADALITRIFIFQLPYPSLCRFPIDSV
jgi:hypothetical protein